jgi:hypothetical protein
MAQISKIGTTWFARVRRKGFPEQSKSFGTKILAEKWVRRIEGEIDHGRAGVLIQSKVTIGELVDRYTLEIGKLKPFGKNKESTLALIKRHLDKVRASDLTSERIVKYITVERKIANVTAGIDLVYLKGVLKVAKALWKLDVSPSHIDDAREILKYMGLTERSDMRDRRPSTEEIAKLREWFSIHSKSLTPDRIDFILDSCFRPPSEIIRLRWDDINHEDRTIVIHDRKDPRKKMGNDQTVPLLGRCYEIIMRQPKIADVIFPASQKTWSSLFPRACRELGIENLTLYDFRHEAISRLVEANKHSIPEMMLVTGHKDPKQLMRYTQLRARDLHR